MPTPGRVARVLLAMYPPAIRDRYGDEIADLLARSSRPVRDLADVAWCALVEQGSLMSLPQMRARLPQVAKLLAVAPLLTMALLGATMAGMFTAAAIDHSLVEAGMAIAVVPVAVAAVWLGRRVSGTAATGGRLLCVPALLAVSILAMSSVPGPGETFGENRSGVALTLAIWWLLLTGLVFGVRRLAATVTAPVTVLVAALAGFALLGLAFTAYGSTVTHANTDLAAHLWYASALTSYDFGLPGAAMESSEETEAAARAPDRLHRVRPGRRRRHRADQPNPRARTPRAASSARREPAPPSGESRRSGAQPRNAPAPASAGVRLSRGRTRCPRRPASPGRTRSPRRRAGAVRVSRRAGPAGHTRPPAPPTAPHPPARCRPVHRDAAGS